MGEATTGEQQQQQEQEQKMIVRGAEAPTAYIPVLSQTPTDEHDSDADKVAHFDGPRQLDCARKVYNERGVVDKNKRTEQEKWHWRELHCKCADQRCASCSRAIAPGERYFADCPRRVRRQLIAPRKGALCRACFEAFLRSELGDDDEEIAAEYEAVKAQKEQAACVFM